jgi:multidrug efflux pump subunit AcrB
MTVAVIASDAESLSRFNMYNSIAVNAMPADGYSTGDAIKAVQETAEQSLPKGYGYDYGGITREENQQSGTTIIIFGICFLMIYLILSALYESFIIPFAVLLSVPCGLMGSFLFAWMFGLENNIYLQTGLIMLIGLLAKTAILLTEYAAERRKAGMGLIASAVSAAKARLRPILMTVLTTVLAMLTTALGIGDGSDMMRPMAITLIGGLVYGTVLTLIVIPCIYDMFHREKNMVEEEL